MVKLVRITTVPLSLEILIAGQMKYMHQKGFHVYTISSPYADSGLLEKKEESIFFSVKMTRTISPAADVVAIYKLVKLLKKLRPQIVHTHTPKAGLIGMIAAKICKVPIRLHTIAGLPWMQTEGVLKQILITVEKLTGACAHKVYPNSNLLKQFLIEAKVLPARKLKVIAKGSSNGIDVNYFKKTEFLIKSAIDIRRQYQISENDIVFIFIGRIVKDKGINELVQAFTILSKKYTNIKLLLVGPFEDDLDPIEKDNKQIINENKNIIYVGFQTDVRLFLAASNILVFPSYREGFPNVPMQAGCFELPSIVTDINGCNEIIENGVNGLIIPMKNMNALKDAMEKMINDNVLRETCSKNARELIVKNYQQEYVWESIFEEYKQLLKEKGIELSNVSQLCKAPD